MRIGRLMPYSHKALCYLPNGSGKKLVQVPFSLRIKTSNTSGGILLSASSSGFASRSSSSRSTKINLFTSPIQSLLSGFFVFGPSFRNFFYFALHASIYYVAITCNGGAKIVLTCLIERCL